MKLNSHFYMILMVSFDEMKDVCVSTVTDPDGKQMSIFMYIVR